MRVRQAEEEEEQSMDDATLCHVKSRCVANAPPISVEVKLDGYMVNMEVDTGASLSLMSDITFHGLWPGRSPSTSMVEGLLVKESIRPPLLTFPCQASDLPQRARPCAGLLLCKH